jgi:hypothetical protein
MEVQHQMIYYRVREAAERAGMKPSALIRKAGVSSSVGSKMLHNSATGKRGGPPPRTIHTPSLEAIARVLGISPLSLMEYREETT